MSQVHINPPADAMAIKKPISHTLTLKVRHAFNTLARIVGMFSGRGYSINSISLGDAEDSEHARMTITTTGEHKIVQQIVHQLEKLVDVIEVEDLTFASFVERELALVKITAPPEKRAEITQVANIFNGKIVDISDKTLTLEITGGCNKVNAAITTLRPFGLIEVARSGTLAMQREFKSAVKIRI